MKINFKKLTLHELPKILLVLGLIASFFAPAYSASAQTPAIQTEGLLAPLAPQLSWGDLGRAERSIVVNGESVTLAGTAYRANEEFNLDGREDIANYYATPAMKEMGWNAVNSQPHSNGVTSVYYHDSGVYASVEIVGCKDNEALACLTVWASDSTDIVPAEAKSDPAPMALGTVSKISPANHAIFVSTKPTLVWGAYTGSDLNHYRYCIDKINNSACDTEGGWTSVWYKTYVTINLKANDVMYWQIEAVLNDNTKVAADSSTWWVFTTGTGTPTSTPKVTSTPSRTPTPTVPPSPPIAFIKTLPLDGSVSQPTTPVLAWGSSTYATSYSYCIDTVDNNVCDTNWISNGTSTFIPLLSGIVPGVQYFWQVRASNAQGTVEGNGTNVWWEFTTSNGPANDTINSAENLPVAPPYQDILSTTSATIDNGTSNSCTSGLGYASVWYQYAATNNRKIYLDTFGTNYDTFIAVWTKNPDESLTLVTCNNDSSGTLQSAVSLTVSNTVTYYIQVAQRNPNTTPTAAPGGTLQFHVKNFSDVAGSSGFWPYIEGLYDAGITGGCVTSPDLMYCPSNNVTRADMAVFLVLSMHGTAFTPPAATGVFDDVPTSYWAAPWIEQLAADGVTSGCGDGNYCPESPVTRAQMAVFLLTAAGIPHGAATGTVFADVSNTYWAAPWIEELYAQGITGGCDGVPNYCPESYVTRDQMAVFLSLTFGFPPLP